MTGTRFTLTERAQRSLLIALSRMPATLQRLLAPPPVNSSGDRMHADVALLMKLSAGGQDYADMTPAAGRAMVEHDLELLGDRVPPCPVEQEVDLGDGLLATRYSGGSDPGAGNPRGLILFFHGGGFALGSRASYTAPARLFAQGTGADVLSVEYRLAPEHPFPAAHEDALTAWRSVLARAREWNVDRHRIVVAGESAGATIAAVLGQQLRGEPVRPALQVLIQPVTDLTRHRGSQSEFATSPALSAKQIHWFLGHYLPAGTDLTDPRVSPLLAGDLSGLPRTIVALGGFDPLHDDGCAYATALLEAGVPTEVLDDPGQVHGFLSFTGVSPSSRTATERIVRAVATALSPRPLILER